MKTLKTFPIYSPPDNHQVNEDIPNEDELQKVISKQKDNKCQVIDKIYSEHLKYSTSSKLLSALLILFAMIWTTVEVPGSWLDAVITCLHKKGLKVLPRTIVQFLS